MTIHEHHHRHELDGVLWTALSSTVPDSAKAVLIINGYSAEGDGGQGVAFWNSADTTAADGGTVAAVTGISTGRWNRIHQGILDVRWFGASADGTTDPPPDDTIAIQTAADRAAAIGGTVYMPPGLSFAVSSTINFLCHVEANGATLVPTGALTATETPGGPALPCTVVLVGESSAFTSKLRVRLPRISDPAHTTPGTWSANTRVGVECRNLESCQVWFDALFGWSKNVYITGTGSGESNADNDYFLDIMDQGQISLHLAPLGAKGYVNSNRFYGGTWADDGEGTAISGVINLLIDDGAQVANNNVFFSPDLEGIAPQYHFQCYGENNTIIDGRWETGRGTPPKVNFSGGSSGNKCQYNTILRGISTDIIAVSTNGTNTSNNRITASLTDKWEAGQAYGVFIASNNHSSNEPVFVVMPASTWLESGTSPSTAYCGTWSANGFALKETGDSYNRVFVDGINAKVDFGYGSAAPVSWVGLNDSNGHATLYGSGVDTDVVSTGNIHFYVNTSTETLRITASGTIEAFGNIAPSGTGIALASPSQPFSQLWAGPVSLTSSGLGGNASSATALELQAYSGNPINLAGAASPIIISASAAACPSLAFTGTLTGNITLQFPDANGLWFCDCSTLVLSGFALTFQSGTTTRTVTSLPTNGLLTVLTGASGSNSIAVSS
jgi:hypothetical protein